MASIETDIKRNERYVFDNRYFLTAILLFLVEMYIAIFVRDNFLRPYVGGYLLAILIYAGLKSFLKEHYHKVAIWALFLAYSIEVLQYFRLVELFHLQDFKLIKIVIGSSFAWADFVAYTLGVLTVLIVESRSHRLAYHH